MNAPDSGRVLVATDNRVIDGILSRHLARDLRVEVDFCRPTDVPSTLAGKDYRLVALLDQFDLCRRLKKDPKIASPRVLMVVMDPADRSRAVTCGADGVWVAKTDGSGLAEAIRLTVGTAVSKKILIVEDSAVFRQAFVEALEGTPYQVQLAENGLEAIDILDDYSPDLIVTDIEMPEMDGLELTTHIRHDPTTAQLPVIIVCPLVRSKMP